ncbi:MAG: putative baseplate assembly protein [Acidimicrobiales bacterium]
MALPAPNLDDRSFQDLVDEAKRMVQQRCPTWTDHNVSDPGVTLIETFAYMVDQLMWRMNKVPDRVYIKFLEMLGLELQPPSAAQAPVTFWLTAGLKQSVVIPTATRVATTRGEDEPIVFATVERLEIVPCSRANVATEIDGEQVDHTDTLDNKQNFFCFDQVPKPGDCFYIGLSNATPRCAVTLTVGATIEGVGVNPDYPPVVWEAWDGSDWVECDQESDTTGGLNRDGIIVLHLPETHAAHAGIVRTAAGWLRCRVLENEEWQPAYSASPRISRLDAHTSGGTIPAVNAQIITEEIVGISEGTPAQRFLLRHRPVVPSADGYAVEVSELSGWEDWTEVDSFAQSGPDDKHFAIDRSAGEIVFGPSVRLPDGTVRGYGKTPTTGLPIRIREYRTGGGRSANVSAGSINSLQTALAYVGSVTNRYPATGGTDAETMDNAKLRGPIMLRTRQRAVTAADYESLALEGSKALARAHAVPAGEGDATAGGIELLVVPTVEDGEHGSLDFSQMLASDDLMSEVTSYLDERRTMGARLLVRPPSYVGMSIVSQLRGRSRYTTEEIEKASLEALFTYFHPTRGGPEGKGWPFGRPVAVGEVFSVLQKVRGVEYVEDVRLYPADPISGTREKAIPRIDLGSHDLVFSYGHQIMVQSG